MSATGYQTIAQEIQRRLATVGGVGNTHTHLREIKDEDALRTLCFDAENDRIAAWFITRESLGDTQQSGFQNERRSTWVLYGFMSFDDLRGSEVQFQNLIDSICDKFAPQTDLSATVELTEPVQARAINYAMFNNVLCHRAELAITVQEFFSY